MKITNAAGRSWHFSHAIGRNTAEHNPGNPDLGDTGGFGSPYSLTIFDENTFFVVSRGWDTKLPEQIHDSYKRIGKVGLDQHHFGDFARNEFTWPSGITKSKNGTIFISDEFENLIRLFDPNKIVPYPEFSLETESIGSWGKFGKNPGEFNSPNGIQFDAQDNIIVVDSYNHRIQKFTSGGEYIMHWGKFGKNPGEFNTPWGITLDDNQNIYVADWGNNRVQKFDPQGKFIMTFGDENSNSGNLNHPADVAIDSENDVYVTDWGNKKVNIYEPNGEIITSLYGDATELSKAGKNVVSRQLAWSQAYQHVEVEEFTKLGLFGRPIGIEINCNNTIIITDTKGRLQVYKKVKDFVEPPKNVKVLHPQ